MGKVIYLKDYKKIILDGQGVYNDCRLRRGKTPPEAKMEMNSYIKKNLKKLCENT